MAGARQSEHRVTFLELSQRDDEQIHLADIAVRSLYVVKVKRALRRLQFKNCSDKLVHELLKGEKGLNEILGVSNGKWTEEIHNACQEYQGLREVTFLLISAPRSHTELTLEQDRQAREKQLLHFHNNITSNRDEDKCIKVLISVLSYSNLKQRMQEFMADDASKAKRVYIVFNGHGKDNGHLSFEEGHGSISNSKFIQDIHSIWKSCQQCHQGGGGTVSLPERISVVMAQCYGFKHEFSEEASKIIDVACLTNPKNPMTKFRYQMTISKRNIKDAVHFELMTYACGVVDKENLVSSAAAPVPTQGLNMIENNSGSPSKDPSSYEEVTDKILSALDVTTLACHQAFSQDDQDENGFKSSKCDTRSHRGVHGLEPKSDHFNIHVSEKSLSDYFTLDNNEKSAKVSMLSVAYGMANLPIAIALGKELPVIPIDISKKGGLKAKLTEPNREREISNRLCSYITGPNSFGMATGREAEVDAAIGGPASQEPALHLPSPLYKKAKEPKRKDGLKSSSIVGSIFCSYVTNTATPGLATMEDGQCHAKSKSTEHPINEQLFARRRTPRE